MALRKPKLDELLEQLTTAQAKVRGSADKIGALASSIVAILALFGLFDGWDANKLALLAGLIGAAITIGRDLLERKLDRAVVAEVTDLHHKLDASQARLEQLSDAPTPIESMSSSDLLRPAPGAEVERRG